MPDLSSSFVASIARALNSVQVPCILWGEYLLNVYGVPSGQSSTDFVIPDDCRLVSIKALLKMDDLSPCLRGALCPSSPKQRYSPPPVFHIHIMGSDLTVDLYPHSETLWFLGPLDRSLASPQATRLPSFLVLASDETVLPPQRLGRGSGAFSSSDYPVLVPTAETLLDAFSRLVVRDFGTRIGSCAIARVAYMELYVEDDGYLDENLLAEPIKRFYQGFKRGEQPVRRSVQELKDAIGSPPQPAGSAEYPTDESFNPASQVAL